MSFTPNIRRFHLVGIGGAAMNAIAQIILDSGRQVSGSDAAGGPVIERLRTKGIKVSIPHDGAAVSGADAVIYSAAIPDDNVELIAARSAGIPLVTRARAQAELLGGLRYAGIAGAHGKTTTSAMIAVILDRAGFDPTYMVGGDILGAGGGARLGAGSVAVVEADEAFGAFEELTPAVATVLNVEADHLDYYGDFETLKRAYRRFMERATVAVAVCGDDEETFELAAGLSAWRFGLTRHARVTSRGVLMESSSMQFDLLIDDRTVGRVTLKVTGAHKLQNALGAATSAHLLGVDSASIVNGLNEFPGVARRYELKGMVKGATVIDDYAHLPKEVEATLEAARRQKPRRLIAVFQPHLYSRTAQFADDFARALNLADEVIVAEVYPAREKLEDGAGGKLIADLIGDKAEFTQTLAEAAAKTLERAREGDLILTIGAGDIGEVANMMGVTPA